MAIFAVGGFVKGALGFGLPLVTMAVLPIMIPVEFALALNAMILPITNLAQLIQLGRLGDTVYRFRHLNIGIVLGVPIGAFFVSIISDSMLMLFLGIFVMIFVLLTALQPQLHVPSRHERSIGALVGLGGGILGALTTANGPIFVMYLVGLRIERSLFVSALSLFFIISGTLVSIAFWMVGIITVDQMAVAALCLLPALGGVRFGNWFGERVPAARFRAMVLVVLAALAANLTYRGLSGL